MNHYYKKYEKKRSGDVRSDMNFLLVPYLCTSRRARMPVLAAPVLSVNFGCQFTNLRTKVHTVITFVRSKIVIHDLHATSTNSKVVYKSKKRRKNIARNVDITIILWDVIILLALSNILEMSNAKW